jgi:hypothetical protein
MADGQMSTTTVEVFEDRIAMTYDASFPMTRASVTDHLRRSRLADRGRPVTDQTMR